MIGVHNPTGAATSPTLISPQCYEWLHAAHSRLNQGTGFLPDLQRLMLRYHPRAGTINPQGRKYKPANQWARPPALQRALQRTFLSNTGFFASTLNCSMEPDTTYCTAYPDDSAVGALPDAFNYRWTGSCIANPEYEPEDMRKAVLRALGSSEHTTLFLVVMVLPV